MKTAEILKSITSLSTDQDKLQKVLDRSTEEQIVAVIIAINEGEKYWFEERKRMQNPQPNMGPRQPASYSMYTFDVYGKEKIFDPFAIFLLNAVTFFPHLTLYVHDGEFGFSPVFAVQYLNTERRNPYLIKFKEEHLDEKTYEDMIKLLYSKENIEKHAQFGLEKIRPLTSYDY